MRAKADYVSHGKTVYACCGAIQMQCRCMGPHDPDVVIPGPCPDCTGRSPVRDGKDERCTGEWAPSTASDGAFVTGWKPCELPRFHNGGCGPAAVAPEPTDGLFDTQGVLASMAPLHFSRGLTVAEATTASHAKTVLDLENYLASIGVTMTVGVGRGGCMVDRSNCPTPDACERDKRCGKLAPEPTPMRLHANGNVTLSPTPKPGPRERVVERAHHLLGYDRPKFTDPPAHFHFGTPREQEACTALTAEITRADAELEAVKRERDQFRRALKGRAEEASNMWRDALDAAMSRAERAEGLLREAASIFQDIAKHSICLNPEREPCGECWPCQIDALLPRLTAELNKKKDNT